MDHCTVLLDHQQINSTTNLPHVLRDPSRKVDPSSADKHLIGVWSQLGEMQKGIGETHTAVVAWRWRKYEVAIKDIGVRCFHWPSGLTAWLWCDCMVCLCVGGWGVLCLCVCVCAGMFVCV